MSEHTESEAAPVESAGMTRRRLIKGAAAAGVAAWTAPVILDSLSSPAAALTCGSCFKFSFEAGDDVKTPAEKTITYQSQKGATCTPAGTCATTITSGQTLSKLGVTFSFGSGADSFDLTGGGTGTITMSGSTSNPPVSCSGPLYIYGATMAYLTNASGNPAACFTAAPGNITPATPGPSSITGVGVTPGSVTWNLPTNGKNDHSGGFSFVIGCNC